MAAGGRGAAARYTGNRFPQQRFTQCLRELRFRFPQGLSEGGYIEGRNIKIGYRWAEVQPHRLPALAAELVRLPVAVIAGVNSTAAALAAKAETSTIPIVFGIGADPAKFGLISSITRGSRSANLAKPFMSLARCAVLRWPHRSRLN